MRAFTFGPSVLAAIRHDRYHHPHPRVQRKMEVLWLKSRGLTHAQIAECADVSPRSVQRYLDEFSYRLSRRSLADKLFFYVARRAVQGDPLTYHRLTAESAG